MTCGQSFQIHMALQYRAYVSSFDIVRLSQGRSVGAYRAMKAKYDRWIPHTKSSQDYSKRDGPLLLSSMQYYSIL